MRAYAIRLFLPLRQLILLSYLASRLSRLRRRPVAQSSLPFQSIPMPGMNAENPIQSDDAQNRTGCWIAMEAYVKIPLLRLEAEDACACEKKFGVIHGRVQLRHYVALRRRYLLHADIHQIQDVDAEQIPE